MGLVDPVPGVAASLVGSCLVVADLHIGVESSFRDRGVMIPSQTDKVVRRVKGLVGEVDPDSLFVLGDLKHNIKGSSWQEREDVPRFLEEISSLVPVTLVLGNHDGGLEYLVPGDVDVEVVGSEGVVLGDVGLVHGHAWPKEEVVDVEVVLIGHNHPVVQLEDSLGGKDRRKAWIRAPLNKDNLLDRYPGLDWRDPEIIVQPAFSDMVGSVIFNQENDFLGPFFTSQIVETGKMTGHLLDGTYIGELNRYKNEENNK